jgi:V/A-type H+-transporting ATPase subunit D
MARISLTKNELKNQREALARYRRFLPTLQLKKQQLQSEVHASRGELDKNRQDQEKLHQDLESWVGLFAEPAELQDLIRIKKVRSRWENIMGVEVPALDSVEFEGLVPDLWSTPSWVDEGIAGVRDMVRLNIARDILTTRLEKLQKELRLTTQRVNLFEQVKIPECLEAIRQIQIVLGDRQTAAVARAKLAKAKGIERETSS